MSRTISRRSFLLRSAAAAGGPTLGAALLQGLTGCGSGGAGGLPPRGSPGSDARPQSPAARIDYGPLATRRAENTGEALLALPAGFRYTVFGRTGSSLSDGRATPGFHDGMAAFAGPGGTIRLVRNHEVRGATPARAIGDAALAYDAGAPGGVTTLDVDPRTREPVRGFVSLGGTHTNCAGGPTPWGSWISCEETTLGPATFLDGSGRRNGGFARPHGYCFEVPAAAQAQVAAAPLRSMGRFVHEAVAVDPAGRFVYETEDRPLAGFYRFVPDERGRLEKGGRLEMLAVKGRANYDTRRGQRVGAPLPVEWVPIGDPDPAAADVDPDAVNVQGFAGGAAVFSRLEGCWAGARSVFFHSTSGGDKGLGQVWEYRPVAAELSLLFESTGADVLDGPDELCVSPRGGLVLCEDGKTDQYLRGLTTAGAIFDFARNVVPGHESREFAGACFGPDGATLFVNVQSPGLTFAIWGPWERGAL